MSGIGPALWTQRRKTPSKWHTATSSMQGGMELERHRCGGAHPLWGGPAIETTHPFHFKMTPSMMLGPVCNHDLNCFLRIPSNTAEATTCQTAQNAMLDAMGDHEYYSASYASKEEPHID